MMKSILTSAAILIWGSMAILPVNAQTGIDNTSLTSSDFRKHVRTFGLVYTLPKEVNDTLAATITPHRILVFIPLLTPSRRG